MRDEPTAPAPPVATPPPVLAPETPGADALGERDYTRHAIRHELIGDDTVRLSVLTNGVQLNRHRSLNFLAPLTVAEDSGNKRFNIGYTPPPDSGARVFNSGAQTLSNGLTTVLTFDSERWDTLDYHVGGALTRLTVPAGAAGKYIATGHVEFAASTVGLRILYLRVNGLTYAQQGAPAETGLGNQISVATLLSLAVGDYVELAAYQSSGGNLAVNPVPNSSPELALQKLA